MSERADLAQRAEVDGKRERLAELLERRQNLPQTYPLSFAQQRLWFLDQLNPGNPFYSIHQAMQLDFVIDPTVLSRALNEVVRRHDALRTSFRSVDGRPVQVVTPLLSIPLAVVDLRHLGAEADERALEIATAEARTPFDLTTGPLLRARLIRLAAARWVLALTIHHILSDGWSMGVFFHELATLYDAFARGKPSPLLPLPIQYPDFAAWQRSLANLERIEEQLGYWTKQLADLPVLAMPTDRPRPAVQSFAGETRHFVLPADVVTSLSELCSQSGATLFMGLLAGFAALLARYTGQQDLPIGVPIAGRTRAELEPLIGFFVNTLVMRIDLSGDPSFREALGRIREVALEAYAHQDVPFERLVEALAPPRDPSRNPLVQVAFQLFGDHAGGRTRNADGPPPQALPIERGTAVFDLVVTTWESDGALHGRVESSADLFDSSTIERMLRHWERLLAAAVAEPDRALAQCPLLDERDRAWLDGWNATAAPYPDQGLAELVVARAAERPDATALLTDEECVTYAELERRATHLAHHLVAHGVGPERIVGLCAERSPALIVGLFAILKAGGTYLPLDPAYPRERLGAMLEDARPVLLLTQSALADSLPSADIPRLSLDDANLMAGSPENVLPTPKPRRLAHVIYTSGSTGRAKGTLLEGGAIGNVVQEQRRHFGIEPGDRVLQFASLSYDAATFEIAMALGNGATLCLGSRDELMPGPPLTRFLRRQGVTVVTLPPSALAALHPEELPALRIVTVAGEAFPARLAATWAPGCNLFNLYGPTEATIWSTLAACDGNGLPPIGWPIANVTCDVVDSAGQLVPVGVAGELWLGGIGIARGYLNRPELTAERFVPDPFRASATGRLYRTGDLVRRRADGALDFLGRIDQQVKIRGVRIEPGEIEALLEKDPGVQQAVVVAAEREEGPASLVACIVPRKDEGGGRAAEQVERWRQLYEETYGEAEPIADGRFQTVGWVSTFTGQPIPDEEMGAWIDGTVERLRRLGPRRVLEIGCGTGLILFRLAPECEYYTGTDLTSEAIAHVRRYMGDELRAKVGLIQCAADEIGQLRTIGEFDLIILNSVVQYFPEVDYLLRVVDLAASLLSPDGTIFLGDVRSLPLLEPLALAIESGRTGNETKVPTLRDRVRRRLEDERELALDPALFAAMVGSVPGIGDVRIEPKRGRYDNELSRYRLDVSLTRKTLTCATGDRETAESLDEVRSRLAVTDGDAILFEAIPNLRTAAVCAAVDFLTTADEESAAADLLPVEPRGVDPEDLYDLAAEMGWQLDLQVSTRPDRLDAYFTRGAAGPLASWPLTGEREPRREWREYGNDPLRAAEHRRLVAELRELLARQLPESMLPNRYLVLNTLPLTPNGKIDRRSLSRRDRDLDTRSTEFLAPRTAFEETIAGIWAEMLGAEAIGTHDDFFELGGHSLLAVQVVARLRVAFDIDIPLRLVFEQRTIAGFATEVERIISDRVASLSEEEVERLMRKKVLP